MARKARTQFGCHCHQHCQKKVVRRHVCPTLTLGPQQFSELRCGWLGGCYCCCGLLCQFSSSRRRVCVTFVLRVGVVRDQVGV